MRTRITQPFVYCIYTVASVVAAALLTVTPAAAAPAQLGIIGDRLSLEDALDLADRYNPSLKASLASIERSQAQVLTSRARPNPSLTFGSLGRQQVLVQQAAFPGMLHGFNVSQDVELPSVRSSRIRAAETRRQSSEWSMAETRLAIRGNVKRAFYEALRHRQTVAVAQGNFQLLEDLRRRIGVQVEAGEAAKLELTRAEAEVTGAGIQIRSAELRYTGALNSLSAFIGTRLGNVELVSDVPAPQPVPTLEELRERMIARHPSLAFAEAEVRRTDLEIVSQKAQRIPQPSIWADWFQQPEAAQYRFGITIPIPVFNRREGQIAEAVAEKRYATAIAAQRRLELTASLEQAWNVYQVAGQQVAIFETGTLLQAEAAVRAAQAAFKFGERGIIEVLDAQRVLRTAQMDYLNARFDRQQALNDLEQLGVVDLGAGVP